MPAKNGHLPDATLDQIRAAKDVAEATPVPMPEWGVTVHIRGLKRGEIKQAFKIAQDVDDSEGEIEALFVHKALVTPEVTLDEARELLADHSMQAATRLLDRIQEVSGMKDGFPQG